MHVHVSPTLTIWGQGGVRQPTRIQGLSILWHLYPASLRILIGLVPSFIPLITFSGSVTCHYLSLSSQLKGTRYIPCRTGQQGGYPVLYTRAKILTMESEKVLKLVELCLYLLEPHV